jgi:hypothetical protein
MRIIISDASCLIDLRKASLLTVFLLLPFEFLIPNTLFEDALLSFTDNEKKTLLGGGLKVVDLPGSQVSRARDVIRRQPRLSIHDGFAFALAEVNRGCYALVEKDGTWHIKPSGSWDIYGTAEAVPFVQSMGRRFAKTVRAGQDVEAPRHFESVDLERETSKGRFLRLGGRLYITNKGNSDELKPLRIVSI